jgi:hypothetical protein
MEDITTISIYAWIVVFLGFTIALTWYTATSKDHIANNIQSQNKMTMLNESMQSALGERWPYVLLSFIILSGIAIGFMGSTEVTLNINDKNAKRVQLYLLIFVILFALAMVILGLHYYLTVQRKENSVDLPNYEPSIFQKKKDQQLLSVIGLAIVVFVGGGYAIWATFFRKSK